MMVTIVGYTVAFIVVLGFTCRPFSAWWDQVDFSKRLRPGGYHYKCINEGADVVANGIVATVQDLIVATLPTVLCWKLQIPMRQKVALYSIFAISYSTVGIGAMRTYTTWRIYFETYDITWVAYDTFFWSLLELHIGAMCANAPSLKVFFKQLSKSERVTNLFSSRSSKSRSSKHQRSNNLSTTMDSHSSGWIPIAFWKSSHSHSASGYLSESNTNIAIDKHGGIVRMNGHGEREDDNGEHLAPEYRDMVILPHHRSRDVEMGNLSLSGRENRKSGINALPTYPQSARTSWLRPIRALSPFPKM
jgi:hypothetical protein